MNILRSRPSLLSAVLAGTIAVAACGGDDDTDAAEPTAAAGTTVATDAVDTTESVKTTKPVETTEAVETTGAIEGFSFTSPEGDYSIVLPGEPTANEQEVPLQDGTTLPITFFIYETAELAAGTASITYGPDVVASLEGARDGAIAAFPGAELSSSEPITQQGRDGLEFVANLSPGGADAYYISRVFLDGQTLYQLIYVGGVAADDPEVVAVFDSFQFTEDG